MNRIIIALVICCGTVGFTTGRTLAQGSPTPAISVVSDPLEQPAESIGVIEKLWRSGAVTSAVIVGGFMLLLVMQRRVAWFREGWRVVWVPAVLGGLTLLVDTAARGITPNASMWIVAITSTVGSALQRPAPQPSPEVRS